jgi:hypothetical protein
MNPDKPLMDELFPHIRQYQELATKHGINDIFQDNGGKLLQLILITGLKVTGTREGNDAVDAQGNEYELKTVNSLLTTSFSTHHHLNLAILKKYRKVAWYFAVYEGIELKRIYLMLPSDLKPYLDKWEEKYRFTKQAINNPKIPLKFVEDRGSLVYTAPEE